MLTQPTDDITQIFFYSYDNLSEYFIVSVFRSPLHIHRSKTQTMQLAMVNPLASCGGLDAFQQTFRLIDGCDTRGKGWGHPGHIRRGRRGVAVTRRLSFDCSRVTGISLRE